MKSKKSSANTKTFWSLLVITPFAALILVSLIQLAVHFIVTDSSSTNHGLVVTIANLLSVIFGIAGALGVICLPFSVIGLFKTSGKSRK